MTDTAGTPEQLWHAWPGWSDLPYLSDPLGDVVVVSAHPDDEVLAVGGLLARMSQSGTAARFVVITDGEASHPGSPTWGPAALATRRRLELADALAIVGHGSAPVTHLGLPDSGLANCAGDVESLLMPLLEDADLVLCPWEHDGHPDHDATGRAVGAAAPSRALVWEYPLWTWHWASPADGHVPWHRARRIRLDATTRAVKERAMAAFASQVHPLSDDPADLAVLPPPVLAHFRRDAEIVFVRSPIPPG